MNDLMPLTEKEREWCLSKTGDAHKLASALMLIHFKTFMRFPAVDDQPLPLHLLPDACSAVSISPSAISASKFSWDGRTARDFKKEIRTMLDFRMPSVTDSEQFIEYLMEKVLPDFPSKAVLQEKAVSYFKEHKIECFKKMQLARYIASAKHQFENRFFQDIFDSLTQKDKDFLDQLLVMEDNDSYSSELASFKKDIPGAKLKNVADAIDKISKLKELSFVPEFFKTTNRKALLKYYERVMMLAPSNIQRFRIPAKYAHLSIFCAIRCQLLQDQLIVTFLKLIHRMRTCAERLVAKERTKEAANVEGKFNLLFLFAKLSLDNPNKKIKDGILSTIPTDVCKALLEDLAENTRKWSNQQALINMHSSYTHGSRTVLLSILRTLDFQPDHKKYAPILDAIAFINAHWNESDSPLYLETPPLDESVISKARQEGVVSVKGDIVSVNKYDYEIAVLERLKIYLGFKGIWVNGSYRYRNPDEDLPPDYHENLSYYFDLLGLPTEASTKVDDLKKQLAEKLESLNTNIPSNPLVTIEEKKDGKHITISPSSAQEQPKNIEELQREIVKRCSTITLIDVLKECDLLVNFTSQMETLGTKTSFSHEELQLRLLLSLFAIGTNTGISRIGIANGKVSTSAILYVRDRFLSPTNIRNAIRMVVNKILAIRDPTIWGEATTSVACDSTQISAWDQNLLNEWHARYKKHGVMIYWHVDQKSLCIYSQLKTCSSSEVGSMLKGILDHGTDMNLNEIFVDTHGQSLLGFGVTGLLGFDLMPRLKDVSRQKLYYVSKGDETKYPNLEPSLGTHINWKLIEDNYREVVKHITALRLGIVEPDVLVKRFGKDNSSHPVFKALIELGKVYKTMFLCDYFSSEALRIEINEGLNVVERLNHVMDFIFYGKLGQLQTNDTTDQELSVLCLHLLQASIAYINTLIIQKILSEPYWQNKLTPQDYRALTPLLSEHINPYGLFPVDFTKRISILQPQEKAKDVRRQTNPRTRKSKADHETA